MSRDSKNSVLFDADTIARKPACSIGARFERLVILSLDIPRKVFVRCDCGTEKLVGRDALISGRTRSCGCLCLETRTRHGHCRNSKRTRLYYAWSAMMHRCYNPNNKRFARYGGRGITVCQRWHRFEHFAEDMGEPPKGRSIERRDNRLGYDPQNCCWATPTDQNNNRCCCRYFEFRGKRLTLPQWSRETGLSLDAIQTRIMRLKWSIEKALTQPVAFRHKRK